MAINTCRAARRTEDFLHVSQATGTLVAPGSYEVRSSISEAREAPAPFNTLQERFLRTVSAMQVTPGPGAYDQKPETLDAQYSTEGSGLSLAAFKSASRRMAPAAPGSTVFQASTIAKNPGPGTYDPSPSGSTSPRKSKELCGPLRPVLEVADRTTPSIPPVRLLPGQMPDTEAAKADAANLCARHTGMPTDMVGPGEYDPTAKLLYLNTQQTIFHPASKDRQLWEPTVSIESAFRRLPPHDIPGPGAYDVNVGAKAVSQDNSEVANTCQFASATKMPYQMIVNPKTMMPGPGQYDMTERDLGKAAFLLKERSLALGMGAGSHFGSLSERSGWTRPVDHPFKDPYNFRNVPGPGFYPHHPSCFPDDSSANAILEKALPETARKQKFHGVHHPAIVLALQEAQGPMHAFNSTDDRPCNKQQVQTTPSPAEYSGDSARGESLASNLREKAKVGRKGVFGSCADRFFGSPMSASFGTATTIGGETGSREASPDRDSSSRPGSGPSPARPAFASKTQRFKSSEESTEAAAGKVSKASPFPSPGDYDVLKEPNYRSPFRVPKLEHLSFGSSHGRFDGIKDPFAGDGPASRNPGPGEYHPRLRHRVTGTGAAKLSARRQPLSANNTGEQVGPGTYGDGLEMTMLKKTFNVSMQAPATPRAQPLKGSSVSGSRQL